MREVARGRQAELAAAVALFALLVRPPSAAAHEEWCSSDPPVHVLVTGQPFTVNTAIAVPAADRALLSSARVVAVAEGDTVTVWVTGPQAPFQVSAAIHSAALAEGGDGTIYPPGALVAFTFADVERRGAGR